MSQTFSLCLKFLIIASTNLLLVCTGSALSNSSPAHNSNNNNNNNNHGLLSDWQRNQEAQLSRVVSRLDQLEMRFSRLQSLIQLRFDNIESGQTTTKLRMEVWGDELNRMNRILESKFDIMLGNIDSKLESKLTAMQRDNRRYQEFLSNAFNSMAMGQEKVKEKVTSTLNEVNSSLEVWKSTAHNFTSKEETATSHLVQNSDKMLNILQEFVANASLSSQSESRGCGQHGGGGRMSLPPSTISSSSTTGSSGGGVSQNQTTSQYQLLGNKVTNMFEDLTRRSSNMETLLKDVVSIANVTRKEVHDGFHIVLASSSPPSQFSQNNYNSNSRSYNGGGGGGNQHHRSSGYNSGNGGGGGGGATSSELMSAVIVEVLASVDSIGTALGRKITEFSRSMDERLEMVSMSINGFLESCVRIQDHQPLLEDHIADLLIKILNTIDNSTRSASELWLSIANQILDERDNFTKSYTGCTDPRNDDMNNEDKVDLFPAESGQTRSNRTTTFSPLTSNIHRNTQYRGYISNNTSSSNSFETLLRAGNEVASKVGLSPRPSQRQQSSHHQQSPIITQPRYEDDEIFEDTEDAEITGDSGEEETTNFPEESNSNDNRNTNTEDVTLGQYHHHHHRHHRRPPRPTAPAATSSSGGSGSTNRRGQSGRADGESLTEADKMSLWESLVVLSPSPST